MSGSTAKSIALVAPGVGCGSSANTSPWSPAAKSMLLNPESILLNDFDLARVRPADSATEFDVRSTVRSSPSVLPERCGIPFSYCNPRLGLSSPSVVKKKNLQYRRVQYRVLHVLCPRTGGPGLRYNTVTCTSGVPLAGSWDITLSPTLPSNQDQTRSGSSETSIGPVSVLSLTGARARFFSRGDVTSSLRPSQHGA